MQQNLFLSRFSQPQAVFILLTWLRLFVTGLLLMACGLIEWLAEPMLKSLLNWPVLLGISIVNIVHGLISVLLRNRQLNDSHIMAVLLLDIGCWSGLMFASGASINPAISYLLVYLSIAALALRPLQAIAVAAFMVIAYTWLMQQQGDDAHHMHMMDWHLWGMWLLFLMNAVIMLGVISLLSRSVREKDQAIARYREQTVRDEHLIAMGTQAANVAHELGTPLSTIAMLVDDIDSEDRALIQQQLQRCSAALQQLKQMQSANTQQRVGSGDFFETLQKEILLLKPAAQISWHDELNTEMTASSLLQQALLALISNAVEAAQQSVTVSLQINEAEELQWDIVHDGQSVSEALLKVLGQQTVTSGKQGLGIGYYLANASIEQLGGRLQIKNLSSGVLTRVSFPLTTGDAS